MLKSEIYTEEVTAEAEVTEDEAKENGAVTQYEVFNTYSKYMLWVPFIMLFNLHENNLALDHVALVSSDISYVHINNQIVTIIKKEGSIFTKGISFQVKHREDVAELIQDLYQFCSRNQLPFKREM